ncbi:MAG: hypothetical protein M3040_16245, partial [Bacteroidota bacterium]|nr:hypothetical protein [Bacteroidota bacterium]
ADDCGATIKKWVEKKNSKELIIIKNRIAESTDQFEQVIADLLNKQGLKNLLQQKLLETKFAL